MTKQGNRGGILTETDLDKIGKLIDARLDVKLDQKMTDYPTKEAAMADKIEILAASQRLG